MERAIRECISKGILKDFLVDNSTEVMNMLTEEFDLNVAQQVWLEEGVEIGFERGRERERQEMSHRLLSLMNSGDMQSVKTMLENISKSDKTTTRT
ncbi:hypothetical protein RsTz2092_00360 [Deferribacterales bacterium RsTz2092]|nr:hypothetical protein AGMMS49941_01340 [Deferribacterales bacterium]